MDPDPPRSRETNDDTPASPTTTTTARTNTRKSVQIDFQPRMIRSESRRSSDTDEEIEPSNPVQTIDSSEDSTEDGGAVKHLQQWWKFKMRGFDDDLERDWWFASTAIPLLSATIAPFANVLSICALVTYWRENIDGGDGVLLSEL